MYKSYDDVAREMGYDPNNIQSTEERAAIRNQYAWYQRQNVQGLSSLKPAMKEYCTEADYGNAEVVLPETDRKDVAGKLDPLLIPFEAVNAYAEVSNYGVEKYGNRDSWKNSTAGVEVYTGAAARHLYKSRQQSMDDESGLPHLYHCLWSVAAAIWHLEREGK